MLILDEMSNITCEKLGELSRLFQTATGCWDQFFGGIPVLLVGDYNQKEPVGELATTSLMTYVQNKHQLEVVDTMSEQNNSYQTPLPKRRRIQCEAGERSKTKEDSIFANSKYNETSDHVTGCQILANARWFELTQAERSKDSIHNRTIDKLYVGKQRISMDDIDQYDEYNAKTLAGDDPTEHARWIRTPVIVKTNRERITINYLRALDFAKQTNTYFIRWYAKDSHWEDKPPFDEMQDLLEDPAFWDIFVAGAPCYLNDTVCKKKRLCNGTRGQFHSLMLDDEAQRDFDRQTGLGETIITLSVAPQGINILIEDHNVVNNRNWSGFHNATTDDSIQQHSDAPHSNNKQIIIPIQPSLRDDRDKPIYVVSPNILVQPSRVKISPHFPLRAGFAITVDKAQGQTLNRVIVALSYRDHKLSNFTYACVYVALSRVQERKHVRILLKKCANEKAQWDTLQYLFNLKKRASIDAYFAGYDEDRSCWVDDEWDMNMALETLLKTM